MARLRESLIIDEISFIEEPLGGNSLLTMKNLMYGMTAMLIGYKLLMSGKPAAELLGVLLIVFIGFLVLYPKKSLTAESLIIGLISYYLFGSQTGQKDKQKQKEKQEAKKREKKKRKGWTQIKQLIPFSFVPLSYIDYVIIIIGIATGTLGSILLHKYAINFDVRGTIVTAMITAAGFSASLEIILEKVTEVKRWRMNLTGQ